MTGRMTRSEVRQADGSPVSIAAARRLRGGVLPHVPPAAAPTGARVLLELEAPSGSEPEVILTDGRRGTSWHVALTAGTRPSLWSTEIQLPADPTMLTYRFELRDGHVVRERRQLEGEVAPLYGEWAERDFRIAVYRPASVPAWVPGTVMYQIFPDRFAIGKPAAQPDTRAVYGRRPLSLGWDERPEHPPRGRDFFGGNLDGLIDRLGYLADLGINGVYLTPIFAARTNHRYDATDYFRIDPRLGDETTFRRLLREASSHGIRVILDGVFNHCSREHPLFLAARADRTSPYYRWFDFRKWPKRYTGWANVRQLPEFAECPEVEDYFFGRRGVAQHWLEEGIAGWRLDVTPWITDGYWRRFRRAVRRHSPDAYLIAEDWGDSSSRFLGDEFDATMNYRFAYSVVGWAIGRITVSELDDRLETLRRDTPEPSLHAQWNLLGSHDTGRLLTRCGGDRERLTLAVALQLAYPGVPTIYYGDEAGLEGDYAEAGRVPFPWDAIDPELHNFHRRAITARRRSAALSTGSVRTVWIDDRTATYAFARELGDEVVVCAFNAGDAPAHLTLPIDHGADARWRALLGDTPDTRAQSGVLAIDLPPRRAGWFAPID